MSRMEVMITKFGYDLDHVESMVRSQWQSQPKSILYLTYRWIFAVFVVATVATSISTSVETASVWYYMIYFTRWGIVLNAIVGVYGAILVTVFHCHTGFYENVLKMRKMLAVFKIYWLLHNMALVSACTLSLIYWAILHTDETPIGVTNILSHITNSVIMFIDVLIVAHPMRLWHAYQPVSFGAIYGLFSFVYFKCGGVNEHGERFFYKVLDWTKPQTATITVFGTLFAAFIMHFVLFYVYKLRVYVHTKLLTDHILFNTTSTRRPSSNVYQNLTV